MQVLTAAERRAVVVVAGLFVLGAVHDLWSTRARAPGGAVPAAMAPAGEAPPAAATPGVAAPAPAEPSAARPPAPVVDLNRATAAELDALPGIGPVLAARIVEVRSAGGPFRRVEDLVRVPGIGPRLLERLRDRVTVSP